MSAAQAALLVHARLLPTLGGTLEVLGASGPCRARLRRMQLSHLLDQQPAVPTLDLSPCAHGHLTDVSRAREDGRCARPAAVGQRAP